MRSLILCRGIIYHALLRVLLALARALPSTSSYHDLLLYSSSPSTSMTFAMAGVNIGSYNLHILCFDNPSHIIWGVTGKKYRCGSNCCSNFGIHCTVGSFTHSLEAALAYSKGQRAQASYLSEKGKFYKTLAHEADEKAIQKSFDDRIIQCYFQTRSLLFKIYMKMSGHFGIYIVSRLHFLTTGWSLFVGAK